MKDNQLPSIFTYIALGREKSAPVTIVHLSSGLIVIRQVILGTLTIGCGGAGYYYNGRLQESVDDKERAYTAYRDGSGNSNFTALWEAYEDAGGDMKQQQSFRNILYSCAGVFGVGFCVSFFFLAGWSG